MKLARFWKDILTVLSTTAASQIILILAWPLLTRTVDQAEIGVYFYWYNAASVFVVLASFRLDMAVFVENQEQSIIDILRLIAFIALCISILIALGFFYIAPLLNLGEGNKSLVHYAKESAGFIFALALIQSFQAYLIYGRHFNKLGLFKVIQSIIISTALLLAAFSYKSSNAMILSHCAAAFISLIVLFGLCSLSLNIFFKGINFSRLKITLIKHYRFPLYSMPADFINVFSNQLPIFFIGAKFGTISVALYALTVRVLGAPISLLAGSILTVFKEKAATEYREKGQCVDAYLYALRSLLTIALIPFCIAWLLAESAFALIFGESWRNAGQIAQILIPMYFLKFIASPLGYTLYIGNWQKFDLLWQVGLLFTTWAVFSHYGSLMRSVQAYAIGYGVFYLVYLTMSYLCAKGKLKDISYS